MDLFAVSFLAGLTSQLPKFVYDVCRFGLADEITVVNTYLEFVDLFWCQNTTNWHLQTSLANTTIGHVIVNTKNRPLRGRQAIITTI